MQARQLLQKRKPIKFISHFLGYSSPSAFIAMFRREMGCTPRLSGKAGAVSALAGGQRYRLNPMTSKLQKEIKQSKPFDTLQQEVFLNLRRTSAVLTNKLEHEFQPFGLTVTQYNVMRIIRGAGPSGISQRDIGNRMVAETPDIPRLLKRLETSGLIERTPDLKDLRILTACLKPAGEELLREIDILIKSINDSFFSKLSRSQLAICTRTVKLTMSLKPLHPYGISGRAPG